LSLLLATLFSASGAARLLHDRLEHTPATALASAEHAHKDERPAPPDDHDRDRSQHHSHDCPICHWLTGSLSIAPRAPTSLAHNDVPRFRFTPADRVPAARLTAFTFLTRGPPPSA
jgi:hypothetical protein